MVKECEIIFLKQQPKFGSLSFWQDKFLLFVGPPILVFDQEKPKVLKKPEFVKVSTIKPEQKGLNLQLKVVKLLVCWGMILCRFDKAQIISAMAFFKILGCQTLLKERIVTRSFVVMTLACICRKMCR